MNKIFKLIWNNSLGQWIICSELGKKGKSSSSKIAVLISGVLISSASLGVIVHSLAKQCFSGGQYCSRDFRSGLFMNSCIQSMSRRGNCWDNAVTESFFHTLKAHVVYGSVLTTRKEANSVLFEYIEIYYNRIRSHSANGWLSLKPLNKNILRI